MAKQRKQGEQKQGNNTAATSSTITEAQKGVLRGCLHAISILNWLLATPMMGKNGQTDNTRLILLRFFTHTIGAQMEKFRAIGGESSDSGKGASSRGDITKWFDLDRLMMAHTMQVSDLLVPITEGEIHSIKYNVRELDKLVKRLLPGEKALVFSNHVYIPQIIPPKAAATGNAQYILGVIDMAEQVLAGPSSSALSPIQQYLGWVCIELVGNNLREIRKAAHKEGFSLADLGLQDLYVRIRGLRNRIAHCSSISELLDIPVIWDLKYLIANKGVFTVSPRSSMAVASQSLVMPANAAPAITLTPATTVASTTTAVSTITVITSATSTAATTVIASLSSTASTALTTVLAPAVIASAPLNEPMASTSSTSSTSSTAAISSPAPKVVDVRQINALPLGYNQNAWAMVDKAMQENNVLLAKIRAVDVKLATWPSLNTLSTEQIMMILVWCTQEKKYELFDEIINAFGKKVDWNCKTPKPIVSLIDGEKQIYDVAMKSKSLNLSVEYRIHAHNAGICKLLAKELEFGTLAMTRINGLPDVAKLIESGVSPWHLFDCEFASQFPVIHFLPALQEIEQQYFNVDGDMGVQNPAISDKLYNLRTRINEEGRQLQIIFEEYGFTHIKHIGSYVNTALTGHAFAFQWFSKQLLGKLTAEVESTYTDHVTLAQHHVKGSRVSMISGLRVTHQDFAGCFISSIHNIHKHFGMQAVRDYILQPGPHSSTYVDTLELMRLEYQFFSKYKPNGILHKSAQDDPLIFMVIRKIFADANDQQYSAIRNFICEFDVLLLAVTNLIQLPLQTRVEIVDVIQQPVALDSAVLAQFGLHIQDNKISLLQLMRRMRIVPPGMLPILECFVASVNATWRDELDYMEKKEQIQQLCQNIIAGQSGVFRENLDKVRDSVLFSINICTVLQLSDSFGYLVALKSTQSPIAEISQSSAMHLGNLTLLNMAGSLIDRSFRRAMVEHMTKLAQEKKPENERV